MFSFDMIGVIITSMELLREGSNEEEEIWSKVFGTNVLIFVDIIISGEV